LAFVVIILITLLLLLLLLLLFTDVVFVVVVSQARSEGRVRLVRSTPLSRQQYAVTAGRGPSSK